MMAYPASGSASQTAFSKDYLAYTGPSTGGGVINADLPYGPINNYGGGMRGGNSGKWPDGLTGSAWGGAQGQLPGVDGISGNRNYYSYNNYNVDPQTQGVVNGRALSGGSRRRRYGNRHSRSHSHRQRGGGLIPQDLVNMGRQMLFGAGSAYNAYGGYAAPTNPLPWKGQLASTPNVSDLNYYRL
jgi:hypothetical protein